VTDDNDPEGDGGSDTDRDDALDIDRDDRSGDGQLSLWEYE
jgi:hypothetical protein